MNIALNPATNPGRRSATIAAPSTPMQRDRLRAQPAAPEFDEQHGAEAHQQHDQDQRRVGAVVLVDAGRERQRRTARGTPAARAGSPRSGTRCETIAVRAHGVHAAARRAIPRRARARRRSRQRRRDLLGREPAGAERARHLRREHVRVAQHRRRGRRRRSTSPPASMTTRVATAAASSTSCVANIAAPPRAACARRNRASRSFASGSSPRVGSSSSSTGRRPPPSRPSPPAAAARPTGRGDARSARSAIPSASSTRLGVRPRRVRGRAA